ncbi:hypothetical protein MAR_018792 [Mya arenaria]|uniref:Uncharacterized protein n=1 Tax=Mya arenaria TaxID=6604 RepID=A0ABY7EI62_MYAAR|nr:hypothetical protein MAR_018792 [Mya arenaria]
MSTKKVKIVALRLLNKNEPGVHNFSIEIVPKNKAKSVIKKRQKEEKYEKDECIIPPTSPKIELPLDKDKKCEIKLRIEGGLKPADDMHDGEDIIVYSAKGKKAARKILFTIPSNESDKASILFTVGDTYKHRVCC